MLELDHAAPSVCSVKVRVGLAEKNLQWQSKPIALDRGEQFSPSYLELNPNGVVPTLVNDGFVVTESSVILEYIDQLCDKTQLMPADINEQATIRIWLFRCLDIHAAVNTVTFATVMRHKILASSSLEEIERSVAKMPSKNAAMKRLDIIQNGLESMHVKNDLDTFKRLFADMQRSLESNTWLIDDCYTMADTALIAYVDRLERLGFAGLWEDSSGISRWLEQSKARSSYAEAVEEYIDANAKKAMRAGGEKAWPELKRQWDEHFNN